ncbi:MAG: oligosaccharide flippase family protein [Candidatus Wallbacteria bacterium]|nr:oligosaccharide flippase family protein [Candidatus Wallbacteria bacterium]
MTLLKKNIIANYFGQGWTALMGLLFVPLYIKYLGMESYGLIGIFAMLQAWLTLLDMGMTPTLSREMARFKGGGHDSQSIRDLLRSIEVIAFTIAGVTALSIWAASGWLASGWLRAEKLPVETVAQAFAVMGIVTALRFVEGIYRSSIVGLQRQVMLNAVMSFMATVRGLGAVGILVWVSPTIKAFFIWQGLISIATVAIFMAAVYRALPKSPLQARFSKSALLNIWRFAAGMVAITFLSLLLTQVDKVILSKLLSLEAFGCYCLANTVVSILTYIVSPIDQAFFPRLTDLITTGNEKGLIGVYHCGAQMVSVLVGSAAMILIVFGEQVVALWTGNPKLALDIAPLVALLALGTMINCLLHFPYNLQVAYGWLSLGIKNNIAAMIILVPAIFWATSRYGAIGAAGAWVALNIGYLIVPVHIMHRRLLCGEKWRWYLWDLILPLACGAGTVTAFRFMTPAALSKPLEFVWLAAASLTTAAVSTLATTDLRKLILDVLKRRLIHV